MFNLEIIKDEYRPYADWLLKTKLELWTRDARVKTEANSVTLEWTHPPIEMKLDVILNKKEGWLYTRDNEIRRNCLRVFDLTRDCELERMIACLEDYLK